MAEQSKKRTAVVAAAVAAALLLTGTFAWNMATDQTILNEFQEEDKGDYQVKLDEDFDPDDPWANKDVFVTNEGDNPVIVRVRLEEFYDLTYRDGTNYDAKEGYSQSTDGSSAIFVPNGEVTDNEDQSSTKLADKVSLIFGNGDGSVATMAEYNAMDETEKANIKWVIDTDGWCYYTRALLAGETTERLLDKATFNKDLFEQTYDSPYDLDYKINVRLQAMSADLSDFGSEDVDAQWTNVDGRVISEDDREDDYEITTNTKMTDEAKALVMGIENPDKSAGKYAANATDLNQLLADETTEKITLSDDISTTEAITVSGKTLDLNGKTISAASGDAIIVAANEDGSETLIKNGTINSTKYPIQVEAGATVKIEGITSSGGIFAVSPTTDENEGETIIIENSNLSGTTSAILADGGMNLTVNDSVLTGGVNGVSENNLYPAESVTLNNCTINTSDTGYFKTSTSELTMTDCTINVDANNIYGEPGTGIFIRDGKVTLNNVNVTVSKTAGSDIVDDATVDSFYSKSSGNMPNYEALQVVLNSYGNIDLTINGGSYETTVDGAKSVYICGSGRTGKDTPETFSNSITITGSPAFSPATDMFDAEYANTTITQQ